MTDLPAFKPAKILVAEDYPINQQVILSLLKKFGLTNIDIAGNGIEVLEALKKNAYNLILMDCQMPEMDGYTATREARKMKFTNGQSHIPIIAMTAHALIGDREKCLDAGMDDYISKPIDRNELLRVLTKWLGDTSSASHKEHQSKSSNQPIAQKSTEMVVDYERLQLITGDEREEMSRFLKMFVNEIDPLLTELSQAIQTRDMEASKIHCHHLKGSAGNCGANQMYELAKKLEHKVLSEEWAEAEKLFLAEKTAFSAVKDFTNQL